MRRRCWVRAISSRCATSVSWASSPAFTSTSARAAVTARSRSPRAVSAASRSADARRSDSSSTTSARCAPSRTASATPAWRARDRSRSAARSRATRSACAARSSDSARPDRARARSSPVRSVRRASVSRARAPDASSARRSRRALPSMIAASLSAGSTSAAASRSVSSASSAVSASRVFDAPSSDVCSRAASAFAARAVEPRCPSCSATAARAASDSLSRSSVCSCAWRAAASASVAAVSSNRSRSPAAVASAAPGPGLLEGSLQVQRARRGRRAARGAVLGQDVAGRGWRRPGRGGSRRWRGRPRGRRPRRRRRAASRPRPARAPGHGPGRRLARRRPGTSATGVAAGSASAADQQRRAPGVLGAQVADGVDGGVDRVDRDGVGQRAEGRDDRFLVLRVDREQRGDRADETRLTVRGEQGAHAVLARQAELERLGARLQRGPLAVGRAALLLECGEAFGRLLERLDGRLVLGVQPFLALLDARDLRLERRRTASSPPAHAARRRPATRAGARSRPASPRPGCVERRPARPAGRRPRGGRRHRAAPSRPPSRRRSPRPRPAGARSTAASRPDARDLDLGGQLGLGGPDALGLGGEVVGVGSPGALRAGAAQQPHAVGSQGRGAAEPLAQRRQPVPDLARLAERRGGLGGLPLEGREPGAHLGERLLDLLATHAQRALVGDLLLERGRQLRQVVGEQAGAGVAQVRLHGLGLARHLGLPAERAELSSDLAGQVTQPRQVGLHGLELAERLLLALAVLEDARGLFDEAAPLLGRGPQHRVELALADDHVHLAAQARVGQQVLDVEQPAPLAVDRVLRPAVAEQGARDRDLGVLDRQRAVGVVDRQRHLGATERRPPGGAGEDDVLHLAAAQRLGALLPHHPGQRVDDVGLARAVGPDHAGDARLEVQGRRRGERLEPPQGEGLEVHAQSLDGLDARSPRRRLRASGTRGRSRARPTRASRSRARGSG